MNKLTRARRAQVIGLLCDGNSLRATSWLAVVSINTVTKLLTFMLDLASRLANKAQLTTDGHKVYLEAVEGSLRK